ncbi:tetraacyldisaccharide 4'-kinase [Pseudopedobacter beijingensis]|uniref:Tetraacyldisaccharide 4'-kinase n=1 Tax=Pseudopedobacter beijingensis TaxID=1207056 RepID=A0ABW4IG30_9SPHI
MNYLRLLLFPFSLVYGFVVWVRNRFYDCGWKKSTSFSIPTIGIGNLEVGGSGKTPLTEYLIRNLSPKYKIATLSRGYGRKTRGFRWVGVHDEVSLVGDEPLQMKQKFPDISVSVCESRVEGIHQLQKNHDLVLLDDAFQHRAATLGYHILVFDYNHLAYPKLLLPAGNYRDLFSERKRADLIVISKCPTFMSMDERVKINYQMVNNGQKVIFSSIKYADNLQQIITGETMKLSSIQQETKVLLITGIAKPQPLLTELRKYTNYITHHFYSDHHQFSKKNMLKLVEEFEKLPSGNKIIITTEKDATRLNTAENKSYIINLPVYQLPIEVCFLDNDKAVFDQSIKEYVTSDK